MDNEIKLITREETFTDLAVRELAKNKATCLCCLQFGRCSKNKCSSCQVNTRYNNCISQMSEYDRLRLDSYVQAEYMERSRNPYRWYSHKQYVSHYIRYVLIVAFVFIVMICLPFIMDPLDKPPQNNSYHTMIVRTIKETQRNIKDCNKDGKINCIDYSINFKRTWDTLYPDLKSRCYIIRNVNILTKMNHLFICVYDDMDNKLEIEPWTNNPDDFYMKSIWGKRYDPKYNIYGETQRWLNEYEHAN